jgi:hypothetical protein
VGVVGSVDVDAGCQEKNFIESAATGPYFLRRPQRMVRRTICCAELALHLHQTPDGAALYPWTAVPLYLAAIVVDHDFYFFSLPSLAGVEWQVEALEVC